MIAVLVGLVAASTVLAAAGLAPWRSRAVAPRLRFAPSLGWGRDLVDRLVPGRRRRIRDRQLPDALDRLGSALRAGQAIGPALVHLAGEVVDPLGAELRTVGRSIEHGAPVRAALAAWAGAASASRDVRLVAAALTIGAGSGGEVARAVDGVASTLRERHEVLAEARALATQARASAGVLAAAPGAFAVLVATVEPGVVAFLLTHPVGAACLVLGVGLELVGVLWMARITRSGS
jgi:tight adherence protein B